MEIEVITTTRPSADTDINPNLTAEEQRWESAGQFQPGRLQKTVFHSLSEAAPVDEKPTPKPRKSRYDWMKGETEDDQAALVPTKLKIDRQSNQLEDGTFRWENFNSLYQSLAILPTVALKIQPTAVETSRRARILITFKDRSTCLTSIAVRLSKFLDFSF